MPATATVVISANTCWYLTNFRTPLMRRLRAEGYRVIAIAPPDDHVAKLAGIGVEYVPITIDRKGMSPRRDWQTFRDYRRILARTPGAVYLGFTIKPNIWGALAAHRLRIPVVAAVSGLGTAYIRRTPLTALVDRLYRAAFRRACTVFFENPDDLAQFRASGVVGKQGRVVAGTGIDLEAFPATLPPSGKPPVFLLIARMLYDKGIGEYVEAAAELKRRGVVARFQLLGDIGDSNRTAIDRSTIEGWVAAGLVEYLGRTDDVRPFIAAADAVVLPSYREGLPRVLLEAGAMTRPLIATDVPGCREVVEDGVNGFLCKPRDAGALADAIARFLRLSASEVAEMGAASRALIARRFDERAVVDDYMAALSDARVGRASGL